MSFIDMNSMINFIGDVFISKSFLVALVFVVSCFLFVTFFGDLTSTCPKCGATYKDRNYYKIRGGGGIWLGMVLAVPSPKDSLEFLFGVPAILLGILFQFKKVEPHVCSSDELDVEAIKSDSTN